MAKGVGFGNGVKGGPPSHKSLDTAANAANAVRTLGGGNQLQSERSPDPAACSKPGAAVLTLDGGDALTESTSTDIDPGDHRAAMEGYSLQSFYNTIEEMLNEDELKESTKLLCAMVATGHLEIKIAVVPKGGIYHDKVGFFEDEVGEKRIMLKFAKIQVLE